MYYAQVINQRSIPKVCKVDVGENYAKVSNLLKTFKIRLVNSKN